MAVQARGKREKREQEMGLCNYIAAIFQVLIACQSMTFISGQGFLNSDTEFQSRKVLQDVALFPKQKPHGVTSEPHDKTLNPITHTTSQIKIIRFEPPFLDFDAECVGMPKLRTVHIHNPSKERELQLSSISARTSHFHASFFDKKNVPPGGNTSFEVVFLARVVGNVENTLFINTVHGTFPYQVFGIGTPNPYRLRPYLGAKVPINSSFSPLISMHNPTSEPLQVTEMYSSSGYLQLQLPKGQHEGDKEQWEIPPFETREVIRARFMGQVEANHTAFIRIKTAQAELSNPDFHILPVEVEVSSAPGIYSALELLDFGTLRTRYDEPKTLPLFLLNSGKHEVQISSITVVSPNPAIKIQFKPVKLKPSDDIFTLVANVTFSALLVKSETEQKGIITVKTKEKRYSALEIPFVVNLLDGTLGYDQDTVLFHFDEQKTIREVSLSNLFRFPVILQNLTLPSDATKLFKVLDFSSPVMLPESSRVTPFSIQYDPGKAKTSEGGDGSLYYLSLHTNASKFSLPLHTYSGIVSYKVLREDKRKLDFGIMGTLDKRQVLFALYNHNPAKILLEKINSTLKNIEIRLVSLTQDSGKNLTEEMHFKRENFLLPSNSCSVFEVTLSASEKEEEIVGSINIVTKYQDIAIPVLARIVIGTLTVKPEKIKFPRSFPGLVVHQTLSVINTFAQATKLECVHSKQIDKRFYYKKLKNQGLTLEPNKKAKIGKVYFDARQSCKPDRCYTGLPTSTTVGHHWLTTLALGPDSVEFDTKRYKEHRHRWKNLQSKGLTGPNTTLLLSADVVMNVEVPVQATLYWPSLLEEESFEFPLTHVGRKSVASLTLVNPADSPVVVQVLPLSLYPQPEAALAAFGWTDKITDDSFVLNNSTVFHLLDPRDDMAKDTMTSAQMVWLEYTLNGKLNHTVVNLFLDPGDKVSLKVEFVPYDDNPKSTVILLRNNLTILDALPLHGRGAYEHLTLGGKAPNLQTSILRFKLTKDLLKDCTRKKSTPSFTVRKWFHANNTGMLPIHITSMTVSGSPCEGYGFRVLDCDQFILQPNTSKKIEIAYTPDFTSYLVLHKLKLVTAQGNEMVFTLNVTLPPYMLPLCQEAVPRPTWELTLYYFIVAVMIALFGGILAMAYLEAYNIWEMFARVYATELQHKLGKRKAPIGFEKRFDLRNIATNFVTGASSRPVKPETLQNAESLFSGKKVTSATLTPTFKLGPRGELDEIKNDSSQQTDPHSDFPPLPSSKLSSRLKGLVMWVRFLFSKRDKEDSPQPDAKNVDNIDVGEKIICPNGSSETRLRHCATSNGEKRKNDKKFRAIENFSSNAYTKPTAEIRPVTKTYEVPKRKNSRCTTPEKVPLFEQNGNTVESSKSPAVKQKDDSRERQSESEESITHDTAKKKALERRHSKSNRQSRESTSSSGSVEFQEHEQDQKQRPPPEEKLPVPEKNPTKVEDPKPLRGKKLRKFQRKQAKAHAREREQLEKENLAKEEREKPSTPSDEEEKPVVESRKTPAKKLTRQQKRRSVSPATVSPTTKKENKFPDKPITSVAINNQEKAKRRNSPPPRNANIQPKPIPKRRSYSYNSDVGKLKGPTGRITIYKGPSREDSRSSSSQEISESSSGESTALWDVPSQQRDVDEDMHQISERSMQAQSIIDEPKRGKEGKRGKETSSPVHLSSGSRSSSYSSILSSASSNDGNVAKPWINEPQVSTPSKKLSRSMSDATGRSTHSSKPMLKQRNPYPPVTTSPTYSARKDFPSARTTSPQNAYNHPARTLPSPSIFTSSFGSKRQQGFGNGGQEAANPQWSYQNPNSASSYSAFGKSPFNLMENLINKTPSNQNTAPQPWTSPFSDNSSLYSTPSPPHPSNPSPPSTHPMGVRQWNSSGSLLQQTQYPSFETPTGNPTAPNLAPQGLGWGDIPSPTSGTSMTTHSIWSVSNAVTMDENRNTEERDPLGVRSIWSNTRQYQNYERHMRR